LSQGPRHAVLEGALTVLAAVALAFLLRTFVVEPFVVNGPSMQNTFFTGDRVLVDRLGFHLAGLKYGEVIVFQPPLTGQGDYIKRVIATAGQTVMMRNGQVYVDGRRMPQPFLHDGRGSTEGAFTMPNPVTVPKGDVFVLGDHRNDSEDSRFFGPVKLSAVQGTAFWMIWPLDDFGPIRE